MAGCGGRGQLLSFPGRPGTAIACGSSFQLVGAEYFCALGILLRGGACADADNGACAQLAIVKVSGGDDRPGHRTPP
jgi:hypothetical protein